jgi:RNA polymerase sigma-70 factor (ECF subfamily)
MKETNVNLQLVLEGCRKQNPMSQRKLYEYYYGFAMHLALRYGKNKDEALEILNDGFLKVFRNIDRYDNKYPFKAWLHRVIVNAGIDYYRAQKNQFSFLELVDGHAEMENGEEVFPSISPEEDMLPIIQELPPAYRMVFNLYVMEEYKHHEIAELLGISIGTSKSNLARAKAKIKHAILKKRNRKIQTS